MSIPVVRGVIDRRILVNYRADPAVLAALLPLPFRPKVVHGAAIAGICLIRLKALRPKFMPPWLGVSSENAAHRIAVEWDEDGAVHEGVYIRRRDTNSRFNVLAGGRLFPGVHHLAKFAVRESADRLSVAVESCDGRTFIAVRGRKAARLADASLFRSLDEVSEFFRSGSLGYSPSLNRTRFQGLELRCRQWRIEPLTIDEVHSSFFDDESLFPRGSIEFDSALLMRGIEHEWHAAPDFTSVSLSETPSRLGVTRPRAGLTDLACRR